MRIAFLLVIFTTLQASSQQPDKNFASLGLGLDFPKDNTAFNFSGSLNGRIGKGLLCLGVGLQFTSFKNITGFYKPLYLNVSLIPNVKSNVFPMIVLQPGLAFYDDQSYGHFFGGGGIGFSGKQQICFVLGYNNSHISYRGVPTSMIGFSVKTMILF